MGVVAGPRGGVGDLHPIEHLDGDLPRLGPAEVAVRPDLLGDLVPDGIGRVEAGHRFLEDHGDLVAPDLAEVARGQAHEVTSLEAGRPAGPAAPRRQQAHHGQGRDRLARPALTDQAQGLSPRHGEAGVLHHREPLAVRQELDAEVLHREQRAVGVLRRHRGGGRWPVGAGRDSPQPGQAGHPLVAPGADQARARRPFPAQRVAQPVGHQVEREDGQHDDHTREDEGPGRGEDERVPLVHHGPQLGVGGCSPIPR
jgi:hypothetical protein